MAGFNSQAAAASSPLRVARDYGRTCASTVRCGIWPGRSWQRSRTYRIDSGGGAYQGAFSHSFLPPREDEAGTYIVRMTS